MILRAAYWLPFFVRNLGKANCMNMEVMQWFMTYLYHLTGYVFPKREIAVNRIKD